MALAYAVARGLSCWESLEVSYRLRDIWRQMDNWKRADQRVVI